MVREGPHPTVLTSDTSRACAWEQLAAYTTLLDLPLAPYSQNPTPTGPVLIDTAGRYTTQDSQAAVDNAKAILEYTDVVAPLDGRTGIRQVDQGNIVRASDATGIVIITQLQPLSILFTLPQQQLTDVVQAKARGEVPVDAFGSDNKTVIDKGTLGPIDNQVDQSTGTIKLKATFKNDDAVTAPPFEAHTFALDALWI